MSYFERSLIRINNATKISNRSDLFSTYETDCGLRISKGRVNCFVTFLGTSVPMTKEEADRLFSEIEIRYKFKKTKNDVANLELL